MLQFQRERERGEDIAYGKRGTETWVYVRALAAKMVDDMGHG